MKRVFMCGFSKVDAFLFPIFFFFFIIFISFVHNFSNISVATDTQVRFVAIDNFWFLYHALYCISFCLLLFFAWLLMDFFWLLYSSLLVLGKNKIHWCSFYHHQFPVKRCSVMNLWHHCIIKIWKQKKKNIVHCEVKTHK